MLKPEKNMRELINEALAELEYIIADLKTDDDEELIESADEMNKLDSNTELKKLNIFNFLSGLDKT
jgi:DNA integrity scanning protein DisA with diadenylate cyclase activity